MKILRSWLQDYIEIKHDNKALSMKLANLGIEVEDYKCLIDINIVVGKILNIQKHPNADKLKLVKVTDGESDYKAVCGASNIEVGQVVPFAKVGAKVADIEIKKTSIRGSESEGMMCSELELGLGQDHTGIKILPNDYKLGTPIYEYLKSDSVFDLDITPNRGDTLSHLGIAREIGAMQQMKINKKPIKVQMKSIPVSDKIEVINKETKLCLRYFVRVIEDVTVKESPDWLKERLIACGAKPINNIVDATNYILLDLGQPLHAFDAKSINGTIIIRKAKNNEDFISLDGEVRNLNNDMIVIANKDKPIAIAGVIGGKDSEVKEDTRSVVLEAAEFDRRSIRKTSKNLSLTTEASYRFERGIDSNGIEYALNKAANLIKEIAGGSILSGIIESGEIKEPTQVLFKYDDIRKLTGLMTSNEEINRILNLLGFKITSNTAQVPSHRHDITIWQDLAEEVARIAGYENIKPIKLRYNKKPKTNHAYSFREMIKDSLVNSGFVETSNYSFLSEDDTDSQNVDKKKLIELENPIQIENKYMRSSIEPKLMGNMSINSSFDPILLFEIGNVFSKTSEYTNLAIGASGKGARNMIEVAINDLKENLKIKSLTVEIRELNRDDLRKYKIKKQNGFVAEIEVNKLEKASLVKSNEFMYKTHKTIKHYREVSRYPSVTRDLAFVMNKSHKSNDIIDDLYSVSDQINRIELFDEFASDKIGKGKKNIAFHLYLQDLEKTMIDKDADQIVKDAIKLIEDKYKAKLRTF